MKRSTSHGRCFGDTYLAHNKARLNSRLEETLEFKEEVDVHECAHCNWEYRTKAISRDRAKKESREDIIKRINQRVYLWSFYELDSESGRVFNNYRALQ